MQVSVVPLYLDIKQPGMWTPDDITDADRLAAPAVKTSLPAVPLQMAVCKRHGLEREVASSRHVFDDRI